MRLHRCLTLGGLFVLFLCFRFCHVVHGEMVNVVELSTNWTLTNQNLTLEKRAVRLPSGVYSTFYGEDVLQSYNDVHMRWIAYDNWTYSNAFSVDPADFKNIVNLTFHGIDTVAEIRLNHFLLGRTDNMFVRYSYDVSKILQEDNLLEIEIKSPVYAALAKANVLAEGNVTVPPNCPSGRYHGECHMNMLRKMQASFAWDWGLAAPSMGLWKSVALEYYEVALIRDIDVIISKNSTHWNMHINVFIDAAAQKNFYALLTFYAVEILNDPIVISDYTKKPISYKAPIITFDQAIPIENVRLWWPNGYGDHKLYPLHFTLNAWLSKDGPSLRSRTISEKSMAVGFRTIELVEQEVPGGKGNTFLFKVNGEEIFMKGTNYIPSHILPEFSQDENRIKHLLYSAREAHLNMIRIWGGGIYESEFFYNTADQLGILIWQDMMFACAMYPVNEDFLQSVGVETAQNAKRIGHHPSIAIFATNNENEVALAQNWYQTFHEKKRFEAEYRELYLATIMHELKVIESNARPRTLVSSPSNGKESARDNYLSDDPQNPNYGDIHFYDVFKDAWNPNIYPRPRFASEYGFQSLPKMQSWQRTMKGDDDLLDLINHRQHHPMAMLPITNLVRRHLPLPLPEDENYAEALIYFSQISQAQATKIETELYRSQRDTEHRTMGALYWQLNDVWVAPSWSSIDFFGNYKLLHYWSKDFMASISIIAHYDTNTKSINVSLTCDHFAVDTEGLEVTMSIYLWSDLFAKNSTTWAVTLKPNGVQYDKVIPIAEIFSDRFTVSNCFLEFSLNRGSKMLSNTFYFPSPIHSAVGVANPEVNLEISWNYGCTKNTNKMRSYSLTITVKHPAIFVYIEVMHSKIKRYTLSRNGYMQMTPVQMVHLEFESNECVEIKRENIKVLTVNQYMM